MIYLVEISSEGDFELGRSYLGCIASKGRAIGCVAFALPCLIILLRIFQFFEAF